MNRPLTRIIENIVHHRDLATALHQRVALDIMGIEVPIDQDLAGIVVNQRPLAMFALGVAGVGKAFGRDIIGKCDRVAGSLAPVFGCVAGEARARGGHVLVDRPSEAAMVDHDMMRRNGGKRVGFPTA